MGQGSLAYTLHCLRGYCCKGSVPSETRRLRRRGWQRPAGGFEGLQARRLTPCAPVLGLPAASVQGLGPCSGRRGAVRGALQASSGAPEGSSRALRFSCIVAGRLPGQHPGDDKERCAAVGASQRCAGVGYGVRPRQEGAGVRGEQRPDGGRLDGTACRQQAAVAPLHAASGEDVVEEPADTREDVEVDGTQAGTSQCAGGDGDGALRETDEAAVGEGACADVWREGWQGGGTVWRGVTLDIPGPVPDVGGARFQVASLAHRLCEEGAGDGGEGSDEDREVDAVQS